MKLATFQNVALLFFVLALAGYFLTRMDSFIWLAFIFAIPMIWRAMTNLLDLMRAANG